MPLASENCVQQSARMHPVTRGRRVFREDAHVDYYGARPRNLSRHTRTRASTSNRVGSAVVTSKHAKRRFVAYPERKANSRGVEVGVSGREEMPLFERERGASLDGNPLFVRQFRYKPRARPSVKSAAPATPMTTFKDSREADSSLASDRKTEGSAAGLDEPNSSAIFYEKPAGIPGNMDRKGKRKLKKKPRASMGSLSSSSSSESSCSSDEERTVPTRNSARMKPQNRSQSSTQFRPLENSAVPAPMLPASSSVGHSGRGKKSPMDAENTVFVCQGKGCSKRGGTEVMGAVLEQGNRQGFDVVGCKCMGRCKYGPVMVANFEAIEEGVEYTCVDPATVEQLLNETEKLVPPL